MWAQPNRNVHRCLLPVSDIQRAVLQYGCLVVNAPTANTIAAAEHGIAMMCALARNVAQADASMKAGQWKRTKYVGTSLVEKTLAIMGFGKVSSQQVTKILVVPSEQWYAALHHTHKGRVVRTACLWCSEAPMFPFVPKRVTAYRCYQRLSSWVVMPQVGSEVARRAKGLGMEVIAYDPYASAEKAAAVGVKLVTLDEALAAGDFFSLHMPLTPGTKNMFNDAAFAKMKKGARIVNVARGGVIDDVALAKALDEGIVAAAALDVFEVEPPQFENHPLIGRSGCSLVMVCVLLVLC